MSAPPMTGVASRVSMVRAATVIVPQKSSSYTPHAAATAAALLGGTVSIGWWWCSCPCPLFHETSSRSAEEHGDESVLDRSASVLFSSGSAAARHARCRTPDSAPPVSLVFRNAAIGPIVADTRRRTSWMACRCEYTHQKSATTATVAGDDDDDDDLVDATTDRALDNSKRQRRQSNTATTSQGQRRHAPPAASRLRLLAHTLRLSSLPCPRTLGPSDPVFSYPELKAGLRRRAADERSLRLLRDDAITARTSRDPDRIRAAFERMSEIAYGERVTPQMREDFMARYGCAAWTDEVLDRIVRLGSERGGRGIVEVGAGNGQWARAIGDSYAEFIRGDASSNGGTKAIRSHFEFVIPFDDMTSLPLSPKVYHRLTKPANDYFHPNVRKCASHVDAVRKWESRGRVLLLVYPPPGPMAIETVRAYVDVYPEGNDTVIYVGEGRDGANCNDEFFDYFLKSGDWILVDVLDVKPSIGGKGYEKMFVMNKRSSLQPKGAN